jgi:hypothetical protein
MSVETFGRWIVCLLALAGVGCHAPRASGGPDLGQAPADDGDASVRPESDAAPAGDLASAGDLSSDGGTGWSWTSIGPMGIAGPSGSSGARSGKLNALVISPADPKVMLIAGGYGTTSEVPTNAGIFRSSDGGGSWTPAVTGLVGSDGLISGIVNALWMDPTQPNVVLASTELDGIFRSADGGVTWSNVLSEPQPLGITRLGVRLFAALPQGVYASSDDGATWGLALSTPSRALVVVAAGNLAYAGTSDGTVFVYQGGAWTSAAKAPGAIHQLAVDPDNTQLVYAAVPDGGYNPSLYASTDGAASFTKVTSAGAQAIAFSAVVAHRLYAANDGSLKWTLADGSANPTWTSGALADDLRDLYMFPNGSGLDDRCYATADQGLMVAETCSVAKNPVDYLGADLSINLMTDFAITPDRRGMVAMMQDFGGAVSADSGGTWSQKPLGTIGEDGYAAVNPGDPLLCYAFRGGFWMSTDGCTTFIKTATFTSSVGLAAANVWAFDPTLATSFYLLSNPSGAGAMDVIYQTTDGGKTFSPVTWPFTAPNLVAISPTNAQHLLVRDGTTLSVSVDGGATWSASTGLPAASTLSVAIHPQSDSTVLAASLDSNSVSAWRSNDGGLSFTNVSTIVPTSAWRTHGGVAFGGVVYRPTGPPLAVVTTVNGAYLSSDDGDHWQRLDTSTTTHHFTSAHWLDDELYLGSYGQGILKSTVP